MTTQGQLKKKYEKKLGEAVNFLKRHFGHPPDLAIVFGSGLGESFIREIKPKRTLAYEKVPHFGKLSVEGHDGRLICCPRGKDSSASVFVLQGRRHYYEGVEPKDIVFPYRALALWGVSRILLTNSSGSLRKSLNPGDLVLIKDHINLMGFNPLQGPNFDILGPRFPAMDHLYRQQLAKRVQQAAKASRVKLSSGVYLGITGPSYETPAEIRAFQKLGGDIIGMSTIPGAIAAAHAGLDVAALGVVTNSCVAAHPSPDHKKVLLMAKKADQKLTKVLLRLLKQGFKR